MISIYAPFALRQGDTKNCIVARVELHLYEKLPDEQNIFFEFINATKNAGKPSTK